MSGENYEAHHEPSQLRQPLRDQRTSVVRFGDLKMIEKEYEFWMSILALSGLTWAVSGLRTRRQLVGT